MLRIHPLRRTKSLLPRREIEQKAAKASTDCSMIYSLSRTKVTMHTLVWSIFAAAFRAGATVPVPFWQQTVEESMYSSVGISFPALLDSTAADIRFAAATWLNEPKVEAFLEFQKWFC